MSNTKYAPGSLVAERNTAELPYRVYSKTTQGNVGFFYDEADADLFAATADLLAALEHARALVIAADLGPSSKPAIAMYDAAIAKATGA